MFFYEDVLLEVPKEWLVSILPTRNGNSDYNSSQEEIFKHYGMKHLWKEKMFSNSNHHHIMGGKKPLEPFQSVLAELTYRILILAREAAQALAILHIVCSICCVKCELLSSFVF